MNHTLNQTITDISNDPSFQLSLSVSDFLDTVETTLFIIMIVSIIVLFWNIYLGIRVWNLEDKLNEDGNYIRVNND